MRAKVFIRSVCVFLLGRQIFGILLWTRKIKSKQKDFAMCVAESKCQFASVLFIAEPLHHIWSKKNAIWIF